MDSMTEFRLTYDAAALERHEMDPREDKEFLHAVNNDLESFSKGDSLICEVHVRQWQTATGTRTEYEVVKVKGHLRAARQIQLPWDIADADVPARL
ncbi:hypothetical protein [Xanthomonas sp. NCPPB 2632]|jgi:hypothetical protein|uniref:hypothetical protein n=1 Tax=Xanthomonas sp. NCPPB 2632 TaxID=3240912 RepID=UPI0035125C72